MAATVNVYVPGGVAFVVVTLRVELTFVSVTGFLPNTALAPVGSAVVLRVALQPDPLPLKVTVTKPYAAVLRGATVTSVGVATLTELALLSVKVVCA